MMLARASETRSSVRHPNQPLPPPSESVAIRTRFRDRQSEAFAFARSEAVRWREWMVLQSTLLYPRLRIPGMREGEDPPRVKELLDR